ncbi:hypothetical protein B0H14DRAFT_3856707, partial [Mycena olivaceomarginata]
MSSSIGDFQNASRIINALKHTNAPALENLSKYHKHQTQLLSTIFSNIEKKLVALVESKVKDEFLTDIFKANRLIHGLERALRGGSLAAWFQFEESQQELAEIQLTLGSKSRNTIRDQYYRDPKVKENKLPVLYTATSTVGDTQGEFLVVQKAIEERPDSLKYVEWEDGAAPPLADIYLVEKIMGGDPFILATILVSSIESDVVRALPRTELLVQEVICALITEQPCIADDDWTADDMQDLRCNSVHLHNYQHQIFVKQPHGSASPTVSSSLSSLQTTMNP